MVIALLMIITVLTHGVNMFHYPYYTNDEGTYMSQAWSMSEEGKLAPYTYWYDHAPAGWIFIAMWAKLTGGYFTFGDAVASGRIFMLVLHVCIAGMLYFITRKISNSILAATIAVLLFSLSPLGIYFQRRILLDNIMVFWSMVSIALLLRKNLKMRHILLSGLCFGIAILTKENAIFFIPAILYGISLYSHTIYKRIAIVLWLAIVGSVTSLYFFYALLKGEFFPVQEGEHRVSLLDTLAHQASRGLGYPFWNSASDFYTTFVTWLGKDPYILIFGVASVLVLGILALRNKKLRIPALLSAFFWAFLMRGGLVIDFYVVPLIPLLALAIGVVFHKMTQIFPSKMRFPVAVIFLMVAVLPSALYTHRQYTNNETKPQLDAVEWIRNNVSADDNVIIDDSIYLELRNPEKGPIFRNADWYAKAQLDPEIRDIKYGNSWKNVDYMMLGHEALETIRNDGGFISTVLQNSDLVASWGPLSSDTYLNVEQQKSTNGDWAQMYKVRDPDEAYLANAWKAYKTSQIVSYGQVIDAYNNGRTTSEGQSYALLRAVWMDDKDEFAGVWSWTKDHMQYRTNDKLFSWLWEKRGEKYVQIDSETASDADQDIALALLMAYKQWGDPTYLKNAQNIISDIWTHEVVEIDGKHYLVSGASARRGDGYLINPSYFSPATYKIFAEVDLEHDWISVVDSSYSILNELSVAASSGDVRLPSDWVLIDAKTGTLGSASTYVSNTADQYGYDAFRVMWRIALDAEWNHEPRAEEYLRQYHDFFHEKWKVQGLASVYTTDGQPVIDEGNISTDVGALSVFVVTDEALAEEFYQERVAHTYNDDGYWGNPNNYYDQNWAWFGTALYAGKLTNFW